MQFLKRLGRFLTGWALAGIVTIALAVTLQTQRQLAMLNDIEGNITVTERVSMTVYNLMHMSGLYGIFILIGLLIAFLVGRLVFRFVKFGPAIIFAVAGAVAMIVMLFAMKEAFFGVHLIGGAREMIGIGLQGLAGAAGGLLFARLYQAKPIER
jgi:hypothetical protein